LVLGETIRYSERMQIQEGIVTISEYKKVCSSSLFSDLEAFSNAFVARNKEVFAVYGWSVDPLHQWSRQWEFPFVFDAISSFLSEDKKSNVDILDMGSGLTFFPFFLANKIRGARISCCDIDLTLTDLFDVTQKNENATVSFACCDIHALPYADNSFDVVYCISVLEHTDSYKTIINEVKRVLRPGGVFVVSFDISLDGQSDIPVLGAQKLFSSLSNLFVCKNCGGDFATSLKDPSILTTDYFRRNNPSLLPWRWSLRSFLSLFKQLLYLRIPKGSFRNLAVFGGVFKKYE